MKTGQKVPWIAAWIATVRCSCGHQIVSTKRAVKAQKFRGGASATGRIPSISRLDAIEEITRKMTDSRVRGIESHTTRYRSPSYERVIRSSHWVSVELEVVFQCRGCHFETPPMPLNDEARAMLAAHDCTTHRRISRRMTRDRIASR